MQIWSYGFEGGLPHSDICGSQVARTSPQLFAACHVLHRLSAPRHPPNALETLDRSAFMSMHGGDAAQERNPDHAGIHLLDDVFSPPSQLRLRTAGRTLLYDVNFG